MLGRGVAAKARHSGVCEACWLRRSRWVGIVGIIEKIILYICIGKYKGLYSTEKFLKQKLADKELE
jgi:hypothetical protein